MNDGTETATPRPWWALGVAAAALAIAAMLVAPSFSSASHDAEEGAEAPMLQVAPGGEIELASLAPDLRDVYAAAAADHTAFTEVRCYCGCEAFLDHRHLLDCFERPEGGWEAHAVGCAVCISEAEEVLAYRGDDVPIDEIVRRIDTKYGAITGN